MDLIFHDNLTGSVRYGYRTSPYWMQLCKVGLTRKFGKIHWDKLNNGELKVKVLKRPRPGFIKVHMYPTGRKVESYWDWGGGDFETGIGAGGHVGHKEMVNFLIDKGARPTLHVMTMLGKTELVKPVLETYPQLLNSLGPHGFTFLHHAQKGGKDSEELLQYFEEKGQTESKISLWNG